MFSLQGGLLTCRHLVKELQLDSQFVPEQKAVESPNSFADKTIKTDDLLQALQFTFIFKCKTGETSIEHLKMQPLIL